MYKTLIFSKYFHPETIDDSVETWCASIVAFNKIFETGSNKS